MKKIYLIGAGGHCSSCIDVILAEAKFQIMGIFDQSKNVGNTLWGFPIIGTDTDIIKYISENSYFLVCVGQIKSPNIRIKLFDHLKSLNANLATVVSPRAYISPTAKLGEGVIVMHDALINTGANVGDNTIINTKALIEHDASINKHCHISTGVILNGGAHVGEGSFIGSNSTVIQLGIVPARSIISAGSFYKDIGLDKRFPKS